MKIKHPGTTKAQKKVLDEIGSGNFTPWMSAKTAASLLAKGLIVKRGFKILGKDRFGSITVPEYEMPVPVHIQWCMFYSEQPDEGNEDNG